MNDLYIKIVYCTIIFVFSFLTSLAIQLNRFAKDRDNKCAKYGLVYISDAIVSSISGFLFGLMTIIFAPENQIMWVVAGILGGFLGQKLIPTMLKVFLTLFKNTVNSDELQKVISNLDNKILEEKKDDDQKASNENNGN